MLQTFQITRTDITLVIITDWQLFLNGNLCQINIHSNFIFNKVYPYYVFIVIINVYNSIEHLFVTYN